MVAFDRTFVLLVALSSAIISSEERNITYVVPTTPALNKSTINTEEHNFNIHSFCYLLGIHPTNCSCEASPVVCQANSFDEIVKESNGTYDNHPKRVTIIYATIAVLSSVSGMIGNAAVIIIAYRYRKGLTPTKLHVAQLAVVNFVFSMVQLVNVLPLYCSTAWMYGQFMCKLTKGVLEIGSLLSSGFFQLITTERYFLVVCAPNARKVKSK